MSRLRSVPEGWTVAVTAAACLTVSGAVGADGAAASTTASGSPATTRVSVSSGGAQAGANSDRSDIAARGRYVAFTSNASNLVAGDTSQPRKDVFVRDRVAHVTSRVSVATGGAQANNASFDPAISADGRYVAFTSDASNLVAGAPNDLREDVFVRDRVAHVTGLVSVAAGGGQANGHSNTPDISADGRYVVFASNASNVVADDTNRVTDVFVRDLVSNVTRRVSIGPGGVQAAGFLSYNPAISADGQYVAFQSDASNLVGGDTNGATDVFVRDRVAHETSRVSVGPGDTEADGLSSSPTISVHGRHVAFTSEASNLVVGDTNGATDVFVRDRVAHVTSRVSVATDGTQATNNSFSANISAQGGYVVVFTSQASNLVAGDTNNRTDVFVRDLVSNVTRRVSVSSGGAQGNGNSKEPSISGLGRYVSFTSRASNFVAGDTNGKRDVFVRDRGTG